MEDDTFALLVMLFIIGGVLRWFFSDTPESAAARQTEATRRADEKRVAKQQKLAAKAQARAEHERTRRKKYRHRIVANLERDRDAKLRLCRSVEDSDLRDSMEALAKREYAVQLAQLLKE